jgi:hypothetical protein
VGQGDCRSSLAIHGGTRSQSAHFAKPFTPGGNPARGAGKPTGVREGDRQLQGGVRYLGIEVDDAITIAEQVEI